MSEGVHKTGGTPLAQLAHFLSSLLCLIHTAASVPDGGSD
jgi:hypothetical protein